MRAELRVLRKDYAAFRAHRLAAAPQESVALIFAGWWTDGISVRLVWRDFWPVADSAYLRRGPAGAQVPPEVLMPAVKRCRMSGEALLLAHTHPFSPTPSFSGIDDGGEDELIPKIAARAPAAPHGGLVLGQAGAAARIWPSGADRPTAATVRIAGESVSGDSGAIAYSRQDLALGPGTAAGLAGRQVAVVGTGGLGWEMATLLWSHGIGNLTLIDPDTVEEHNRPRLRGSTPADVGRPKVAALSDLLRRMRPGNITTVLPLDSDGARASVCASDLIVCGTDTLVSRCWTRLASSVHRTCGSWRSLPRRDPYPKARISQPAVSSTTSCRACRECPKSRCAPIGMTWKG